MKYLILLLPTPLLAQPDGIPTPGPPPSDMPVWVYVALAAVIVLIGGWWLWHNARRLGRLVGEDVVHDVIVRGREVHRAALERGLPPIAEERAAAARGELEQIAAACEENPDLTRSTVTLGRARAAHEKLQRICGGSPTWP